jgi:2',3'-cyclic-nucleotide 2'-phosphodiesterase (5'-nucleotidase family)
VKSPKGNIIYAVLCRILFIIFLLGILQLVSAQRLIIIYTSNVNCNLEACDCETTRLGGMVYLAQHLDSLRNNHPELILVDSGDFFNSYSLPQVNTIMWDFIYRLQYDAIGLGDQEFVEGTKFLNSLLSTLTLPFVGSNLSIKNRSLSEVNEFVVVNRNILKIGILGVILPSSFSFIRPDQLFFDPPESQVAKTLDKLKTVTQFNILLVHGSFQTGIYFAEKFPEIQVVIAGHSQEKESLQKGNQFITQAGYDGQYLGFLEVKISEEKIDYTNRFLPVHSKLGENPDFRKKIDEYYFKMDKE